MSRIVCWFSCGAASAVATKLAIEENARSAQPLPLDVVRVKIREEHPDNDRFAADCEKWFGVPVVTLINEKFDGSIYAVFEHKKYIAGLTGAPCTMHLKKDLMRAYELPGDVLVIGYSAEEQDRYDRFLDANAEKTLWPVLMEAGLMHADCLAMVQRAGITLPAMYQLGYRNNNCIGCVKAGAGYWNKIRVDFPAQFYRMAALEQKFGAKLTKHKEERVFLHDLPPDAGDYPKEPEIQCGIFCELAERDMQKAA